VTSAVDAQQLAQEMKSMVLATATKLSAKAIDLFFLGPAALAVAIGHRWNAMPTTQLYEYDPAAHEYKPSLLLSH
jgi:2-keto-3-deoxy-L-rhamnonate aldolase RhmA